MRIYDGGSYKDLSGRVFYKDEKVYRTVSQGYKKQYDHLIKSGLYNRLVKEELLIAHQELEDPQECYKIIEPDKIPFVSYPYEWSFSQLKNAALITLQIQRIAMDYGMILKDASAYNVQFINTRPVFIDTLSFDFYEEGKPWYAYGQFCRHFIAPLSIITSVDIRLSHLMRLYLDGIPLDLASRILGMRGSFFSKRHITLHSKLIDTSEETTIFDNKEWKDLQVSKSKLMIMIDELDRNIDQYKLKEKNSKWSDYYQVNSYSEKSLINKVYIVEDCLSYLKPNIVWDFGCNDGKFSKIALDNGVKSVIAFDNDAYVVEKLYRNIKDENLNILPLIMDFTNPSPGLGFDIKERKSINERGLPDCIMALAFIHHLAISSNIDFSSLAEMFSNLSKNLIIEFIPKNDIQVLKLLRSRDDIFTNYTESSFENEFLRYYRIIKKQKIDESGRTIYMMSRA